jgi:hypothetical protein
MSLTYIEWTMALNSLKIYERCYRTHPNFTISIFEVTPRYSSDDFVLFHHSLLWQRTDETKQVSQVQLFQRHSDSFQLEKSINISKATPITQNLNFNEKYETVLTQ